MKNHLALFIALAAILFAAPRAYAADFTLWINGANPTLEEDAPYMKQGRVMVPLRLISESFGFDVTWNGANRSVSMAPANDRVKTMPTFRLKIGEHTIYADGKQKTATDVGAEIRNNYTFVPLRAIAELFGYPVRWNASERAAIIGNGDSVPYIDHFNAKDMDFSVDGKQLGTLYAFAEDGQLYVRADYLARALGMTYQERGRTFSDDPFDLTIRLEAKDGFHITFDSRYTTSSDGLDFGRYDMNNYKIMRKMVFIPLGRFADAKHMDLKIQGNRILLTTDPTPDTYPITIMDASERFPNRFSPSRSGIVLSWNGHRYVLKSHSKEMAPIGQYMDYLYSEEGRALLGKASDATKYQLSFGHNNHFYLQRQAGMVIGGISD
ncbi:MAG: copper amine oxidase N-terminal domain-containing protein [Peptoniphilus sp.]|nr:copper amine oxidase N-terminal domain-containing protein [Peptoniphilus sp.]MDY3118986.1 copper amine oxidase N-terminal domain-containing protein [Peptoniphilus sp.]